MSWLSRAVSSVQGLQAVPSVLPTVPIPQSTIYYLHLPRFPSLVRRQASGAHSGDSLSLNPQQLKQCNRRYIKAIEKPSFEVQKYLPLGFISLCTREISPPLSAIRFTCCAIIYSKQPIVVLSVPSSLASSRLCGANK